MLNKAKDIRWKNKLNLDEIIVRLWVIYWDICRYKRNAIKDKDKHNEEELKKELWNLIFSTIKRCNDLWFNPEDCIVEAVKAQMLFKKE